MQLKYIHNHHTFGQSNCYLFKTTIFSLNNNNKKTDLVHEPNIFIDTYQTRIIKLKNQNWIEKFALLFITRDIFRSGLMCWGMRFCK